MQIVQPTQPRRGNSRRTTLVISPEQWELLKQIEQETGARPSVIARRALDRYFKAQEKEHIPS